MENVSIIGIDLAKNSFQLRGAQADGSVAFRKKLSRGKLLHFLASQPRCVVAMEACASSHYWGRETEKLGHDVNVNGGGIMHHAERSGGPVAAAQNCATHGPLLVVARGRRCTAWSSMRRFDWRLSTRG